MLGEINLNLSMEWSIQSIHVIQVDYLVVLENLEP